MVDSREIASAAAVVRAAENQYTPRPAGELFALGHNRTSVSAFHRRSNVKDDVSMSQSLPRKRTAVAPPTLSPKDQLLAGREIMRLEATALWELSNRLNKTFCQALHLILACRGSVSRPRERHRADAFAER
jgi:hypothetical protein